MIKGRFIISVSQNHPRKHDKPQYITITNSYPNQRTAVSPSVVVCLKTKKCLLTWLLTSSVAGPSCPFHRRRHHHHHRHLTVQLWAGYQPRRKTGEICTLSCILATPKNAFVCIQCINMRNIFNKAFIRCLLFMM